MLYNPNVQYYSHKLPFLGPILNQISPVTATLTLLFPEVVLSLQLCGIKFWYESLGPLFRVECFHLFSYT